MYLALTNEREGSAATSAIPTTPVLEVNERRTRLVLQNTDSAARLLFTWGTPGADDSEWHYLDAGVGTVIDNMMDALYLKSLDANPTCTYTVQGFRDR